MVRTPSPELKRYEGYVHVGCGGDAFARAIQEALEDAGDPASRRERVRGDTWDAKARVVIDELAELGFKPLTVPSPRDVVESETQ